MRRNNIFFSLTKSEVYRIHSQRKPSNNLLRQLPLISDGPFKGKKSCHTRNVSLLITDDVSIINVRLLWQKYSRISIQLQLFYSFLAFSGILVTIGRLGGAGILYGWQIPSIIAGIIITRSLFTSRYWDIMGQKIPS